nr:hypothetical protein [Kitasatospora aureofaciens]
MRAQLDERQRIAPGAGHDPIRDRRVQVAGNREGEQFPGIGGGQPLDPQLRHGVEQPAAAEAVPGREDQAQRVGVQPPGDEGQRLGRLPVEPVDVVHQTEQRQVRRRVGQHGQGSETHKVPVRRRRVRQGERRVQRVPLPGGQPVDAVQVRS